MNTDPKPHSPMEAVAHTGMRQMDQLRAIHGRLVKMNDYLTGQRPKAEMSDEAKTIAAGDGVIPHMSGVQMKIDTLLEDIQSELMELEGTLGVNAGVAARDGVAA